MPGGLETIDILFAPTGPDRCWLHRIWRDKMRHPQFVHLVTMALLLAASSVGFPVVAMATEQAVRPEKNPPGDIPDDQVFITYSSPEGFSLKVPEGWSRTDLPHGARFSDKYNTIQVTVALTSSQPDAMGEGAQEADEMRKSAAAVVINSVRDVKLEGGPAVAIVYKRNSEANAVTNKKIRLEAERYLVFGHGKLVTLDMTAPAGADNADQWRLMSNSVRLK